MSEKFQISQETAMAALSRIVEGLTRSQQMALANAVRHAGKKGGPIPITANEQTIRFLLSGKNPLIREQGRRRFLTPLGRSLGVFVMQLPEYNDVPDISKIIPTLPQPEQDD